MSILAAEGGLTNQDGEAPDVLAQLLTALHAVSEHTETAFDKLDVAGRALQHLGRRETTG